jgi:PhnB protein
MDGKRYVPRGAQPLTPYVCPRDAASAIDWYRKIFGAVESSERFVDDQGRVGHAEITIDGATIMISDAFPDYGAVAPEAGNVTATFALNLYVPDADATVAAAVAGGARLQRPVKEEFHGSRVGALVDPFGIRWMIGTHVRDVGEAEMKTAAEKFKTEGAPSGPVEKI